MALSQRHRSEIYNVWAPQLGEEVAEALISHFPARDLDEPVTKEFVEVKVSELRAEIADVRSEIAGLRGELHSEIAGLRVELHSEMRKLMLWSAGMHVTTLATAIGVALAVS